MVMKIHRYSIPDPLFHSVMDFERGIDELFGDFFVSPSVAHGRAYPHVDVAEYGDKTEVVAELPGLSRDEVKISIQDGVLTLKGDRKRNAVPENAVWIRNEIRPGEFVRTVRLPHDVNLEAVSAELANGILRIVLPKAEEARLREIAIR
jgi:HSP20 family protein